MPELTPSLSRAIRSRKEPTVPMLIKLPRQRKGLGYERPFNAVLLHGIVQGILQGRIREPQDVAEHLQARRELVPLVPREGAH